MSSFDARIAKALQTGDVLAFRGYPGLRLVVTATRKTWTYRYAQPETGKQKQLALGLWPAVGFGDAVAAWGKARGSRSKGVDVGSERRAEVRATRPKCWP